MTLPYELRVENTFADTIKINARQIIRGTEKGGAGGYKFFTGIVPIGGSNSFVGNRRYFDKQLGYRTELLLFCFSRDNSKLWVFYFPGYDKRNTRERLAFATEVLPYLISKFVYIYEGVY